MTPEKNAPKEDLESIRRKLNELDRKIDQLTDKTFVFLTAILHILEEKEIVSSKEMIRYLEKHKHDYAQAAEKIAFEKMMRKFSPGREKTGEGS
jgi:hypothetical protein